MKSLVSGILLLIGHQCCLAQLNLFTQPYSTVSNNVTVGQMVDMGGGLVQLTQDIGSAPTNPWQASAMWSNNTINLDQSFYVEVDFFFGCNDGQWGGDGMTFVLQNDPRAQNAIGGGGGFLGYGGNVAERVRNSVAIEFDTFNGNPFGGTDVPEDHVSVLQNGWITNTHDNGPEPVDSIIWGPQAVRNNRDLEACVTTSADYYSVRIEWTPPNTLTLYEEGVLTFSIPIDRTIFGTDDVLWGFTGGSASASNEQWIAPSGTTIPWECTQGNCCVPYTTTINGADICPGDQTTLDVQGNYLSYTWTDGVVGDNRIVDTAGTFSVIVEEDQNGRTCPGTAQITINALALPTVDAGNDVSLCDGESTTLNATGANTYIWSNGLGTGSSHSVSPAVTTSYIAIGTSGNGCINSDTVEVLVNPLPNVIANAAPAAVCIGASSNLTASGASTYTWDQGLGNGSNHSVSPNSTQTYTVTGIDLNNCSNSDQVVVTVNPLPVADAGPDQQICIGDNTTITASGGNIYTWDNGLGNGATHPVSPASTTTYVVTVEDINGCIDTDDVTIVISNNPGITITPDTSVCLGESLILSSSSGAPITTWLWDHGLGAGQSHSITPTNTITYTVTGSTATGCTGTASVTVDINQLPIVTVSASDTQICDGETSSLMASGALNYQWDQSLGTGANHLVNPINNTTYSVSGTDVNGCVGTDQIQILVHPIPSIDAGNDQTICNGDQAILTAIVAPANNTIWNQSLGSGMTHTVSLSLTTEYIVTTTTTEGCTNSDSVIINVEMNPVVDAGSDQTVCSGTNISLLATSSLPSTFNWVGVGSGAQQQFSVNSTATYFVEASTSTGCLGTDSVIITVSPLIVPNVTINTSSNNVCLGDQVIFTVTDSTGGGNNPTYDWLVNNTSTGFTGNTFSSTQFRNGDLIKVIMESSEVCAQPLTAEDELPVNVALVSPNVTIVQTSIPCEGDSTTFEVQSTVDPGANPIFSWYVNGSQSGNGMTLTMGALTINDLVELEMQSSLTCAGGPVQSNDVEPEFVKCICPLTVPNAISPNGDSDNDVWEIGGLDCYDNHMIRVYNRYGGLMYRSEAYVPWDGFRNGKPVPVAVYYYVIEAKAEGHKPETKTGTLTIMR